jgi:hypothetical protein
MFKNFIRNIFGTNYIKYDNLNSQWNDGYISVHIGTECIEFIIVDEYMESNKNEDICGVDDILEMLKKKYHIRDVIRNERNWR